jgi:hypothetical protein
MAIIGIRNLKWITKTAISDITLGQCRKGRRRAFQMLRTLAISAVAAAGLLLLPGQATTTKAAPSIAPKIATPESAVEQVRRRGGRSYSGRSFRSGRHFSGRSFGGRRYYSGRRSYRRSYAHRGHRWRRSVIIGAGLPFFFGGYPYYYDNCSYYYRKWKRTGSRYWRHRYYDCRYW